MTLHASDTYGLMHAVMLGEISHLNAVRAQVAILSFWARLGLIIGGMFARLQAHLKGVCFANC